MDGFGSDSTRMITMLRKASPSLQLLLFSATFNERVKDFALRVAGPDANQVCSEIWILKCIYPGELPVLYSARAEAWSMCMTKCSGTLGPSTKPGSGDRTCQALASEIAICEAGWLVPAVVCSLQGLGSARPCGLLQQHAPASQLHRLRQPKDCAEPREAACLCAVCA